VLEATGVYQVLAWDITLLPGPVKGQFSYLYMVMDVWSRRILGVEVHERECSELASAFVCVQGAGQPSGNFDPAEPLTVA
jgi:transposase InsO family protein